ncbi:MBL fold metallo-hydrolase [Chitinophaga nivalis]|uniref:MBL fold metallo-hydrolase n=1 Tax=Chitinophaga nivalis TaxID=2991709 RepID=A0ABT3IQD6_9BACT|nr:MBL fold metallo-hydrolase [Chitinophaga nivalis]MCW3464144.1 MBL fold metallo-hydrolase [Chitinophaga nivalis]MCW3486166.1 MBL fold metallo-hydrolase [Chitinophaga nivalis]
MSLTITGYSTALFATWYFVEELGLLFDAGDGLSAALLQKSRKINQVFISHADRDHLTGLLQLNQLNARTGFPVIYYPKDSQSFPAMAEFVARFDPHTGGTVWQPVAAATDIRLRDDLLVRTFRNGHVVVPDTVTKSLSYQVIQTKKKLKPAYLHLSGEEIRRIGEEQGKESLSTIVETKLLGYSGDTPVESPERWDHTEILIHEATFLGGREDAGIHAHGNKHSTLEEVMEMVSGIHLQTLILGHFSSRYTPEQIDRHIRQLCDKYAINIPVHRILPGQTVTDILHTQPVNQ